VGLRLETGLKSRDAKEKLMSNKGMPSLLALLGLVAVAGYQNRDRLRDMIADARTGAGTPGGAPGTASGGLLDEIGRTFGAGGDSGRNLKEGLGSLLDRFRSSGYGGKADSWVSAGASEDLADGELESALGDDTLDELARRTGLSRAEIVSRLKTALPETINRLTPRGRLPDETEAGDLI
jgi:uncharacterized protein YidB (DUF937 family)